MHSVDKWRYRCPRGHTGWEMSDGSFWCKECYRRVEERAGGFDRVRDLKTDELLSPPELRDHLASTRA